MCVIRNYKHIPLNFDKRIYDCTSFWDTKLTSPESKTFAFGSYFRIENKINVKPLIGIYSSAVSLF